MLRRSYLAVWTQFVHLCLAVSPASTAQSLSQATPPLLTFAYNNTSPLATLASKTPVSLPASYIIARSNPRILLLIDKSTPKYPLSIGPFTRTLLLGIDEIVDDMKHGDRLVSPPGYEMHADNVGIRIVVGYTHGDHFTTSVAETVLRGTWELFAEYGFSTVEMDIFLESLGGSISIGEIVVWRTLPDSTVAPAVGAATDT